MRVLGIETTCDETAASVVELGVDGRGEILSNEVLSQIAEHAAYGGVVPEIAARAHVEVIDRLVARALRHAGVALDDIDGIAAAAGPGLIGGVLIGLTTAKALALVTRKPLLAVNHLEAHALTARLTDGIGFPYLLLLASGGHTQLVAVRGVGDYVRIGTTIDDAIGEAFDKVAKLLGLPYPGGPHVEKEAARGNPERFALPRPLFGRPEPDFSLSGLKTALRIEAERIAPLTGSDIRISARASRPPWSTWWWTARAWGFAPSANRPAIRPRSWWRAASRPTGPCAPRCSGSRSRRACAWWRRRSPCAATTAP
jgi:N6-L-threonylcarbamoyladenine synthase